ncbi:MAG: tRNA-dihydrouridine synthase family protein [Bacteroidales bacterium]|jgi:tRNA-dihydrouridine synthase B
MEDNITKIYLAPMRGLTVKAFRSSLFKYYFGIDACVLPFVSVTESSKDNFENFSKIFTQDELTHNAKYTVIPQIIGKDPEGIVRITKMFVENGFVKVNLNLGCPMPQVIKRDRGSGLIPHIDVIDKILDGVCDIDGVEFSVKIRLGKTNYDEVYPLIDVLNRYPLDFVALHPRLATDRYEGKINLEVADKVIEKCNHQIIYNGDIVDIESFKKINNRYPNVKSYMIGRGLLSNPGLAEDIKGVGTCSCNINSLVFSDLPGWFFRFNSFYNDLIKKVDSVDMMKAYWKFFINLFDNDNELYNKMIHANSLNEMTLDYLIK